LSFLKRLGFGFLLLAVSCAQNPATGKRQLRFYDEATEIELGQQAEREFLKSWRLLEHPPELKTYVSNLGVALARVSERPNLPWRFQILDDPVVNAFALPGGSIFVSRGLLGHLRSEAELVAVLGHEIGHVTAQHAVHRISQQQLLMGGVVLGAVFSRRMAKAAGWVELGLELLFLKYSRDDERQADQLGLRYLERSGYDPSAAAQVFDVLSAIARDNPSSLPTWLSTHPAPEERRKRLAEQVAPAAPSRGFVRREEFLEATAGLLFGPNPFDPLEVSYGVVWLRKGLLWKIPSGWQRRLHARSVAVVSPDGELFTELRELPVSSVKEAVREFSRSKGMTVEGSEPWKAQGISGEEVRFLLSDPEASIRGVARFFSRGGGTLRMLGATPLDKWDRSAGQLQEVARGLEPLASALAENLKPQQLELVRLLQPMTFNEFLARYPSQIEPERLRLINGVENAEQELPAGSLLRRVVGAPIEEWLPQLESYVF
jgi:predicted Zn-dependent protease